MLACMGFLVVKRLIKSGREIPFEKSGRPAALLTEKILLQNLCAGCPFYENDCDFIQYKDSSFSCGGFKLVGQLFEAGIINPDDMKQA